MQPQANGPLSSVLRAAVSVLWRHRVRMAIGLLVIALIWGLVILTPLLLGLAILERGKSCRRLSLLATLALIGALAWLWREFRRHPFEPRGRWHACEQCGVPISNKSRARFCSTGCRQRGRLTWMAKTDDRAAARLARLDRPAPTYDPASAEIPF
jgi:hypothetical protein